MGGEKRIEFSERPTDPTVSPWRIELHEIGIGIVCVCFQREISGHFPEIWNSGILWDFEIPTSGNTWEELEKERERMRMSERSAEKARDGLVADRTARTDRNGGF